MKKIISMLLVTLLIGVSNVYAKDYSVVVGTRNDNVANYCDYPIVSKNCDNKKNPYHVGVGQVFHISGNGENLNGYCIDPHISTPEDLTYTEVEDLSEISSHLEALKYICSKTEGNNDLRIATIKAYSANTGLHGSASNNVIDAYEGLLNGKTEWNTDFGQGLSAGQDILKGALELTDKKTNEDKIYFTKQNDKLTLTTTVAGKIEIKEASKYEIYINGSKQTNSTIDVKPGTYQIELKGECVAGDDFTSDVSFSYNKDDLTGVSSSEYNIRYFKNKSNPTSNQRLIVCDKNNGSYPNCDEKGNCKITDKIEVTCEAEKCEDIKIEDNSGICAEDGTTVVTVTEAPNDINYKNTNCISKLPDATKTILGSDTNPYCEIRCSENYKLTLPGPDANVTAGEAKDAQVVKNAGSYFTIATEDEKGNSLMYDETTYTCYGKMNFDAYKKTLHDARALVVKAYNELSYLKGYKKALQDAKMTESGCQVTGSYRELYFDGEQIKENKTSFPAGKDLPECPKDNVKDSEILELETNLKSAITTAKKAIEKANAEWNDCISWDFDELNEILKQDDCNTSIDFVYQFDECGVDVVVDKVSDPYNVKDNKSTASKTTLYTGICGENGDLSECNKSSSVKAYEYINQTETIKTTYKFDNDFRVNNETGKIECDASKTGDEYSDTMYGFPISLEATRDLYPYEYTYKNIGHDFSAMDAGKCSMGRFDDELAKKNSHKCYYDVNNCYDCKVECEDPTGDNCDFDFCDGDCIPACVGAGCILDFSVGFLATYRTLSLNDPFPNSIVLLSSEPAKMLAVASEASATNNEFQKAGGSNWNTSKGKDTVKEITALGENIYSSEPQYSITLRPSDISEIKRYNAQQEENGNTYLNSTINCVTDRVNDYGQCISEFVHDTKWDFVINKDLKDDSQVLVNGTPFIPYKGSTGAFVGPAWK